MKTIKVKVRDISRAPEVEMEIPTACPECGVSFTDNDCSDLYETGWSMDVFPAFIRPDGTLEYSGAAANTVFESMTTGYRCGQCGHVLIDLDTNPKVHR